MEKITLGEIIDAVKGKLLTPDIPASTEVTGARSDNRKVEPGDIFFAFVGEKMDGHRFVKAALEAGAAGAVVSAEPDETDKVPGKFYVLVADTMQAAGDLAAYYRSRFDIPVIGVTGSVGKTTMKDMIASVLSEKFNVLKTEANFNNNIGLPRTLFRLNHDTEVAVVEMGMNHMGEIDYLVNIAKPTIAVITNVGEAHIGNLGSRENIFKAKSEIFNGLAKGGLAVMNADDEYLPKLRQDSQKQSDFSFIWVGESADADLRAVDIEDTLEESVRFLLNGSDPRSGGVSGTSEASLSSGTDRPAELYTGGSLETQGIQVTIPALGRHMIYPALTAAVIGRKLGMTWDEIVRGIADYVPTAMRMETWHVGDDITIYNDTYNANPQSMKAGLTTLSHTKGSRRIAVLGDMFELGDMEEELHRGVGRAAAELNIDTLITVGERARFIADEARAAGLGDIYSFDDTDSAREKTASFMKKGAILYFKASHAMSLEKLAQYCREHV